MMDVTKKWERLRNDYRRYIRSEKRLSENTVEAYMDDYEEFMHFILRHWSVVPEDVTPEMISRFMRWLYERRSSASQARRLSGVKSLYNYLLISERIQQLPTENIEPPKT
ncbi:MAG: site-specific integrase, partial [Alistipes sp.]|nr:site-specific integrase [Alistipes sp.]